MEPIRIARRFAAGIPTSDAAHQRSSPRDGVLTQVLLRIDVVEGETGTLSLTVPKYAADGAR